MRKILSITLSLFFLLNGGVLMHAQECHNLLCFNANSALMNSCEEFSFYARVSNGPWNINPLTVTFDFGDGSTPVTLSYVMAPSSTVYPETGHVYTVPGTYIATVTVTGGNIGSTGCTSVKTASVDFTGGCEVCSTLEVLSTGYDPGTSLPINSPPPNGSGGLDPNWTVLRRFDLVSATYTPDINTMVNYSSAQANVIYPLGGYCPPPLGRSRYISANSSFATSYGPHIYTYRRSFTLPGTLPTTTMYSLVMSLQALGYVFDVQLNGVSLMSSALPNSTGPVQLSVNSCSGLFQTGVNNLDVTVAYISGGGTQLDAEVILYDCPLLTPCPSNTGWTSTYSWNTSWGYGWFYFWSYWYCVNVGSLGGPCPPTYYVCPVCPGGGIGGGGIGLGWYWVYVSGWGWMWVQGGSSGSGSISCPNCIASFAPIPGNKYLLSAWVKEKNPPQAKTTYTNPKISLLFTTITTTLGPFTASGNIIDGWQRVEAEFTIPSTASSMDVQLDCATGDCYFDDVRILPFDGSMKSYVYDPVNLRLVAELDERNFATLYEYDEEGKLIRVKKETEKGKMTIKENRDNTKK